MKPSNTAIALIVAIALGYLAIFVAGAGLFDRHLATLLQRHACPSGHYVGAGLCDEAYDTDGRLPD